ncbi:MAG: hypothetical protein J0M29_16795 [Chitinophagales bacterium]|nr:hypothetical protein [Chitinophagales bacterium]
MKYNNLMKSQRLFRAWFGLLLIVFGSFKMSAQIVSNDLKALGLNGNIVIRVSSTMAFTSYFSLNNGNVDLEFHFGLDDPRNGVHIGLPMPQPNGQIYIRFSDLGYEMGDTLSFIATENFQGTTIKHYVFNMGNYFPESGGPIQTCPRSIKCSGRSLLIKFDPGEIIIDQSSVTLIRFQIPSLGIDITSVPDAYLASENAFAKIILPVMDCNQLMLGTTILTINGFTCHFVNGQLTCPPWAEVPNNLSSDCSPYFDECLYDLLGILAEAQYSIPCQQWMTFGPCTITNIITRHGKVAIGTDKHAPNRSLTVKNGIITDKVKITNHGWADYVFDKQYPLASLDRVESYIKRNGHLPGIPSGNSIESSGGFELGEVTILHQEKIEEIFLHLITIEKEISEVEALITVISHFNKVQIK